MTIRTNDPLELQIADALSLANIRYTHASEPGAHTVTRGLDFWLPDADLFIEVKAAHTPRVERQMAQAEEIIVVQGRKAAAAFCRLIREGGAAWTSKP